MVRLALSLETDRGSQRKKFVGRCMDLAGFLFAKEVFHSGIYPTCDASIRRDGRREIAGMPAAETAQRKSCDFGKLGASPSAVTRMR